MTPLASRLYRDTTRPIAARRHRGEVFGWIGQRVTAAHFFECSAVFEFARTLFGADPHAAGLTGEEIREALSDLAFLPAELTWLEWEWDAASGKRMALLLVESEDGARCFAFWIGEPAEDDGLIAAPLGYFPLRDGANRLEHYRGPLGVKQATACALVWNALSLLNVINRPRLCEGIERPLSWAARQRLKRPGIVGRFPLQGFTEMRLRVGSGLERGEPKPGGVSCDRPLHFVRKHKRRVWGVWTEIPWHWRGNGSLGIKQTRYRVEAAPGAVPSVARLPAQ